MQRSCDSCGKPYEAKRAHSRYCSETCKKRAQRQKRSAPSEPAEVAPDSELVNAIRLELESAGRLDSVPGRQALRLAERMGGEFDTGSAIASLSRELRAVMDQALKGVAAADGVDELKARRDGKRASAG